MLPVLRHIMLSWMSQLSWLFDPAEMRTRRNCFLSSKHFPSWKKIGVLETSPVDSHQPHKTTTSHSAVRSAFLPPLHRLDYMVSWVWMFISLLCLFNVRLRPVGVVTVFLRVWLPFAADCSLPSFLAVVWVWPATVRKQVILLLMQHQKLHGSLMLGHRVHVITSLHLIM